MTSEIPPEVLVEGAMRRMDEAHGRIARAIAMLPEGDAAVTDLRLVATMLDDALVLLEDIMGGRDAGLRGVRCQVEGCPEAHRPRRRVVRHVRPVLAGVPPARPPPQGGGEAQMTVREDIRGELEHGARLQTFLVSRCAREGIDVQKVLSEMEREGEIEVLQTALVMGRFVPIYGLRMREMRGGFETPEGRESAVLARIAKALERIADAEEDRNRMARETVDRHRRIETLCEDMREEASE